MTKHIPVSWLRYGLAVLLALLYNDWLLGPILNPHMSTSRSLISELSAVSQPHHSVFQSLDITAGVLTLVYFSFIWRLTASTSYRSQLLLTIVFLVIGVDSIIDASLPIACAPSVDAQCNLLATHSAITTLHLIESSVAGALIALAPLVWWRYYPRGRSSPITQSSFWLVAFESCIGLAALLVRFSGHGSYGLLQRTYETGLGLWIGLVAYAASGVRSATRAVPDELEEVTAASTDIITAVNESPEETLSA